MSLYSRLGNITKDLVTRVVILFVGFYELSC